MNFWPTESKAKNRMFWRTDFCNKFNKNKLEFCIFGTYSLVLIKDENDTVK